MFINRIHPYKEVNRMPRVPETFEPLRRYGNIEVGQFYDTTNDPETAIHGVAEVIGIRA